jgi:Na+-transporting methylmalonyl-CoA/oxaloacetate decarboxylase gamma subunit
MTIILSFLSLDILFSYVNIIIVYIVIVGIIFAMWCCTEFIRRFNTFYTEVSVELHDIEVAKDT